jgi:hypothetical protein
VIFASTILYALAKKLGSETAQAEFMGQVGIAAGRVEGEPWRGIPAAATVARLAAIDELQVHVNVGGTVIGKARSMAGHDFLQSKAEIWFQCDDDVEVSALALEGMAAQARYEACVVIAPCLQRETAQLNIRQTIVEVQFNRRTVGGGVYPLQPVAAGGFGCVAISRVVLEHMHELAGPGRDFEEVDGITRRALFGDEIHDRHWWTEDLAFCRSLAGLFPIYAVRCGTTRHGGRELDLVTLEPKK